MKTLSITDVVEAIRLERAYQDAKWGKLDEQNDRDPECWIETLREELSEAEDADFRNEPKNFILELVQVAAVAIAALQQLGPKDLEERVKKHRSL